MARRLTIVAGSLLVAFAIWWLWNSAKSPDESAAQAGWPRFASETDPGRPSATGASPDEKADQLLKVKQARGHEVAVSSTRPAEAQSFPQPLVAEAFTPMAAPASPIPAEGASIGEHQNHLMPMGWYPCAPGSTAGPGVYQFVSDASTASKGRLSAKVFAVFRDPSPQGAGCCQFISAAAYKGKRVAFSADLKTMDAIPGAMLTIRADAVNGRVVAFDNMAGHQVPGTRDWLQYTIVIDIPTDANVIMVGAVLSSNGTMWLDETRLDVVDNSWAITGTRRSLPNAMMQPIEASKLTETIFNPGFEATVPAWK